MPQFCYCSPVLPGNEEKVKLHWRRKAQNRSSSVEDAGRQLWQATQQTDFQSWLQHSPSGTYYLHYLDGPSLATIFSGLRAQIQLGNACAKDVYAFYRDVLGKDYLDPATEPELELCVDVSWNPGRAGHNSRRAFCWPLLRDKVSAHRALLVECQEHLERDFGTFADLNGLHHVSIWMQSTSHGSYAVVYTEERAGSRGLSGLLQSDVCAPMRERIAEHTGWPSSGLVPRVEWLTAPQMQDSRV